MRICWLSAGVAPVGQQLVDHRPRQRPLVFSRYSGLDLDGAVPVHRTGDQLFAAEDPAPISSPHEAGHCATATFSPFRLPSPWRIVAWRPAGYHDSPQEEARRLCRHRQLARLRQCKTHDVAGNHKLFIGVDHRHFDQRIIRLNKGRAPLVFSSSSARPRKCKLRQIAARARAEFSPMPPVKISASRPPICMI